MNTMNLTLSSTSRFDWSFFLRFQARRLVKNIEWINNNTYGRTFCLQGEKGFFNLTPRNETQFDLSLSIENQHIVPIIVAQITQMLDLKTDVQAIDALFSRHFSQFEVERGIHILGILTFFEAGIRAICGQHIAISAATNLMNTLAEKYGSTDKNGNYYFPEPIQIIDADFDTLKAMRTKKETLKRFANWCFEHKVENENDIETLIDVKGIGSWTLNYLKLRYFNDPDIWLKNDLGIKQVISHFDNFDPHLAAPYRTYLTLQMWNKHILSLEK